MGNTEGRPLRFEHEHTPKTRKHLPPAPDLRCGALSPGAIILYQPVRASLLYTSLHPSNEAFLRSWPATSQLLLVALVAAALIDQLGLGGWPLCPPQTCNVYF